MRMAAVLMAVTGMAVIAGLVVHFGVGPVVHSLAVLGVLGLAAVCAIHLLLIAAMGLAWWVLLPGAKRWSVVWARLVRDAAAEVLPLSQLAGYVLGARALAGAGVSGNAAAASTIVDITQEFSAQIAFVAIALSWLVYRDPLSQFVSPAAGGLAVALGLAAGFVVAQRRGFRALGRLADGLGRNWAARTTAGAGALHGAVIAIHDRPERLWAGFAIHLACWIAGAAEIWLALWLMGEARGFGVVLVIESLLSALRSVAFAVPNAIGVQEGGYVMLGAGFGLPPETALALSLLKRARDFVIGLPVLGAYHLLESGRLWSASRQTGRDRMWLTRR